jgi:DNA-binding SARP family transcriptional activator/ActR/RegA family two-component response regulator
MDHNSQNHKRRVLIFESQEDWQNILRQAFPESDFEIQSARTHDEAICALEAHAFDLAVIAPDEPSETGAITDENKDDAPDSLQSLVQIKETFTDVPLIVVAATAGQNRLKNAPESIRAVPLMPKQQWDRAAFTALVRGVLSGDNEQSPEKWGPPEPEISLPSGKESAPEARPNMGMTRPLSPTGMTRPLASGLQPPVIGSRIGRPRVLVVEDRDDWQHLFAQVMEREDYFWRVATNYDEALERLRHDSFHVVLLDLMLSEGDLPLHQGKGWQLLDHLVTNFQKTKVIVASGEATRSDVARLFMRYPIKGFIDKDAFSESELRTVVREQLSGPSLRVQTFGAFRIWRDGKVIDNFEDRRAEIVLKILITRRGQPVSADELIEILLPGSDPKVVYAELGASVNSARIALEPDLPRPGDSSFIIRNGTNFMFNFMANVSVDVQQLRQLVSEGHQHERTGEMLEAIKNYQAARSIYLGDYLPGDRFAQWAIQERTAAQSLYTDALNRLADLYAEQGHLDLAIEAASRSLQVDAYSESTYRRLMRYHYCKGDKTAALAVYRNMVKLFSEFFGEEPGIFTQRLYDDIQAGHHVSCVETSMVSGEWRVGDL